MLTSILKEKDFSYAWLARRVGVNRSTVRYWAENKVAPKAKYHPAIAQALGLELEEVQRMFDKNKGE